MKRYQGLDAIAIAGAAALLVAAPQPSWAAQTEITGVKLNPTSTGLQLIFNTQGNNRPPVFTVNRGNTAIADISNSQLRLPDGPNFRQENPAPGVSAIEIVQLDASTIRVTVTGTGAAPTGEVIRRDAGGGLVLNFASVQQPAGPSAASQTQPNTMGQRPAAAPPFMPRAVAPPVGDMSVGPIDPNPDVIDLNTSERIPRLLLREAPVREVLTLLARAAGVNVAFAEATSDATTGAPAGTGQTISLDIENESVQDVFNYVLRVTGLQANRVGQTIFVGKNLPPEAQNRIVKTIRLNQMRATSQQTTVQTLSSEAQTGGSVSQGTGGGVTTSSGTTALTAVNRQNTITDNITQQGALEILESYGANGGAGADGATTGNLLAGLQVVADARTNSVTLIGTPRKVELATSVLTQLDVRKRQALINVKFVDVNLLNSQQSNADFQTNFGTSLFGAIFDATGLTLQRGTQPSGTLAPQAFPGVILEDGGIRQPIAFPGISIPGLPVGDTVSNFFASLVIQIQSGNAKILTNPTLLVQEGSAAQVNLTQEIFSGIESTVSNVATSSGGATTGTQIRPIIRPAGVIFNVTVDRIDDNGFITLNISPEVSSPSGTYSVVFPGVSNPSTGTLLAQRRLETGQIRLRDGQTLLLSGIIQDIDRSSVTKIPILGDIPLLGRLFRRESNQKQRQELVVLVTPKIVDDSQSSNFGYQYSPGPGAPPAAP
ncbi:MAG: AMIN domain-containing protein [Aphanocapsa sp. GSE-SYN-MK-11-07L]|nr:AMIN domain-containing protein [Aphanocapsa sp. GSE-SYN-MK-11-07L]